MEKIKINQTGKDQKEIEISEHAVLRYFERILGYDIKKIKEDIMPDRTKKLIEFMDGYGKFTVCNHKLVVTHGVVVTVVPND